MTVIALPSKGNGGLNEDINKRFGKCESVTLVSLKNKDIDAVETFPIQSNEVIGNMGTYVASLVNNKNASIALVRFIGSKAYKFLNSQAIEIYQITEDNLKVKECVELYIQGKLTILSQPNAHLIED
ncbi:MAG: NifB/NifX family molybdenum-iron cluster-binding protein [Candidatus Lokiarchaeota archaeon]|nr:NifB/NifX family molybdenum-iron cluster-binding protein [Candidatus Lokiarchaeota archaeon]